jgi:putative ABC transport system permease protein
MAETLASIKMSFAATFQPLAETHFGEQLQKDLPTGNVFYLYGFGTVAVFILLIACINYMNLATARATKRAKEVGMRKVLGASRAQLIVQFLGESFAFTAIAAVAGLLLAQGALSLTPIGSLMGKEHLFTAMSEPLVLLSVVGLVVLVGVVAGLYPAFYLAAISPMAALTRVRRSWRSGLSMRQSLVLLQLLISIGVIACTLLMRDQMRFVHSMPLGFDKDNRLIVTLRGYDVVKNIKTLKSVLRAQPNVLDVTTIDAVPGSGNFVNVLPVETNSGAFESVSTDRIVVGSNFVDAMRLKVLEGRGFSEALATDVSESVIVNESFVQKMGWTQALGKRLKWGPSEGVRVVGVVKDFHYASLHNPIGPMMMHPIREDYANVPDQQKPLLTTSIIVVMSGENLSGTVDAVQSAISKFDPRFNFEPVFLDDKLSELYRSESSLMKLTGIFSGICIFIAVMGLFGLAAFTTEQRTKEIGIRMVLGASDSQIAFMLSRYLMPLVLFAAIPASILSYYAIERWLQRFVYRAEIGWLVFVGSTLAVALVAVLTVMLQSLKTTRADPIKALRYE